MPLHDCTDLVYFDMIKREIHQKLLELSEKFPVVAVIGPRQSGKTTLVRSAFKDHQYVNLEEPDTRLFAAGDPRGFLQTTPLVIDEFQRVPELLSYIQTMVDTNNRPGRIILTGSQNFLISEKISQTLAGRVAILRLLPFSIDELSSEERYRNPDRYDLIYRGFYPPVYDRDIDPLDWYPNYISTYVERDVRQIKNITDLNRFTLFMKLLAGRVGQLLNYTSLAVEAGISPNTARDWIGMLEASFVVFTLQPWHANINKRLVKQPKIYFVDPGLAVALLEIRSVEHLKTYHQAGSLFENMMIVELLKHRFNRGLQNNLFFLRDSTGREIDCLLDHGTSRDIVEIKSGMTVNKDFFVALDYYADIQGLGVRNKFLVYGGEERRQMGETAVLPWRYVREVNNP